jgi:hypothetical protein
MDCVILIPLGTAEALPTFSVDLYKPRVEGRLISVTAGSWSRHSQAESLSPTEVGELSEAVHPDDRCFSSTCLQVCIAQLILELRDTPLSVEFPCLQKEL